MTLSLKEWNYSRKEWNYSPRKIHSLRINNFLFNLIFLLNHTLSYLTIIDKEYWKTKCRQSASKSYLNEVASLIWSFWQHCVSFHQFSSSFHDHFHSHEPICYFFHCISLSMDHNLNLPFREAFNPCVLRAVTYSALEWSGPAKAFAVFVIFHWGTNLDEVCLNPSLTRSHVHGFAMRLTHDSLLTFLIPQDWSFLPLWLT